MKRFLEIKDCGVEWIWDIPSHWEIRRLGVLGQFSSSGIDKKIVEGESLVSMINYMDVYRNSTRLLDSSRQYMIVSCPESKIHEHQVQKGDLIFLPSSETQEDLGLSSLVDEYLPNTVFSYHVIRLQFSRELYHGYKKYLCNNHLVLNQFSKEGKGTTRQIIGRNVFRNIKVAIPPLSEQKQIVSYLERKTKQIDRLIENKQKLIDLLKEQRTAIINQVVTKGIDPNAHMKDSGIEWLGEIPKHWEVKQLKLIGEIVLGKMLTSEDKGGYIKKPYLRAQNISWERVNIEDIREMWFSEDELSQLRLKKNDLLFSEGGEVGRTAIWNEEKKECYIQNSVHKVSMLNGNNPRYYLYHSELFGITGYYESIVNRVSIAHLTKEKLKEIKFLSPPSPEQNMIADILDKKTTEIDNLIEKHNKTIELLKEYRTSLISSVVTGKIDVRKEVQQ